MKGDGCRSRCILTYSQNYAQSNDGRPNRLASRRSQTAARSFCWHSRWRCCCNCCSQYKCCYDRLHNGRESPPLHPLVSASGNCSTRLCGRSYCMNSSGTPNRLPTACHPMRRSSSGTVLKRARPSKTTVTRMILEVTGISDA